VAACSLLVAETVDVSSSVFGAVSESLVVGASLEEDIPGLAEGPALLEADTAAACSLLVAETVDELVVGQVGVVVAIVAGVEAEDVEAPSAGPLAATMLGRAPSGKAVGVSQAASGSREAAVVPGSKVVDIKLLGSGNANWVGISRRGEAASGSDAAQVVAGSRVVGVGLLGSGLVGISRGGEAASGSGAAQVDAGSSVVGVELLVSGSVGISRRGGALGRYSKSTVPGVGLPRSGGSTPSGGATVTFAVIVEGPGGHWHGHPGRWALGG
jgi:hypothetical protein